MKAIGDFLMDKGWRARERTTPFWFVVSWVLLNLARIIFIIIGDDFGYSESLNHLGILAKLRARRQMRFAISNFKKAERIADNAATWLNLGGALMEAGAYEAAKEPLKQAIEAYGDKPGARGNARSHHARTLLRTGQVEQAGEQNKLALEELEKGRGEEDTFHLTVWKTSALMTEARIRFASGNCDEAQNLAQKALKLAKEMSLPERTRQASELVSSLRSLQKSRG